MRGNEMAEVKKEEGTLLVTPQGHGTAQPLTTMASMEPGREVLGVSEPKYPDATTLEALRRVGERLDDFVGIGSPGSDRRGW